MRGMLDGGYFVFPRNVFSSRLGTHRVDAVLTGRIPAGKEKLEIRPPAEADDGRIRHITGSSIISVGKQLTLLVHRVDAALPRCVPAPEEELEAWWQTGRSRVCTRQV